MKSALFVDFDNVYTGLRKLDQSMADQFAQKPQRWMHWLVTSLELPEHAPADARRRVLVRRCYLNPQVYQRFRPSFNLAGFEIIDCPALTSEGKTSTDIHMVLDIIDLLQHEAHYDEFIVFSADADFTPVLRKLRRWDRRTTVLAIGFPSAAYRASADLLIDQDLFVREALGIRDDESIKVEPAASDILHRQNDRDLSRAAQDLVRKSVAESPTPVALPRLATIILAQVKDMDASTWAGFGSFRQLVESWNLAPLVVSWEGGGTIMDPHRHHKPARAALSGMRVTDELAAIASLVKDEVVKSAQPVPCARIAQIITTQHANLAADWNGSGSFRKFLELLELDGLIVDWNDAGGRVYDPVRHTLKSVGSSRANGSTASDWGKDIDLLPIATQIHDVTNAPLMAPADYLALFNLIAEDLAMHAFDLNETGKRVRDRIRAAGHAVSRADVTWVLRGLLLRGHVFGTGEDAAQSLASKTADNIRTLCLREQMVIDQSVDAAISRWIGGSARLALPHY